MDLWGLTGGIASGKSTVASLLRGHQVPVIDADDLYHELIAPDGGHPSKLARAIGGEFGGEFLMPTGIIDRKALAAHVFADARVRDRLEKITHPAIAQAAVVAFQKLEQAGFPLAFYDVPLLYERRLEARFCKILVVWVPQQIQIERLQTRDGVSREQALLRLASQMSLDEKKLRADVVIDNSKDEGDLKKQVQTFVHANLHKRQT